MPFVQLHIPKGALSDTHCQRLSERLAAEVMDAEGAPDTPAARAISWLLVHEHEHWIVGGQTVTPDEAPRYVVEITMPEGTLDEPQRAAIVERVNNVIADLEEDGERLYTTPAAWVLLHEQPEGFWGTAGQVVRYADIRNWVYEAEPAAT